MKKITKFLFFSFSLIIGHALFVSPAKAVCPVCTVAVGAGLGLSRYLGIDDAASGVWLGGFIVSLGLWSSNWLKKKNINFSNLETVSILFWLAFTLIPLKLGGVLGHPLNTLLGIDKLFFGIVFGIIVFIFSMYADKKIKHIKGKQLIDFQKVMLPVSMLLTASIIMFIVTA